MSKSNIPSVIRMLKASVLQMKEMGVPPDDEGIAMILNRIAELEKANE